MKERKGRGEKEETGRQREREVEAEKRLGNRGREGGQRVRERERERERVKQRGNEGDRQTDRQAVKQRVKERETLTADSPPPETEHSVVLKEINVPLWSNPACQNALREQFGPAYSLPTTALCAGAEGRDACDVSTSVVDV